MKKMTRLALAISTGLGMISAPAVFAGGPLDLNPNDPDNFTRYANGGLNIPFNPDQGALGPQSNAQAVANTVAAFQVWEDIPTATGTYSNNGLLPFDVDETNFAPFISNLFMGTNISDGLSPIVYDADGAIFAQLFGPGSGVLGFASYDTFDENGFPIEGVSFLNGGSILNGFPEADFFGVQVHEFGHYSGMAHTVVNGQAIGLGDTTGPSPNNTFGLAPIDQVETMFPFALRDGGEASVNADDIAFYSRMYPEPGFVASTVTITGRIISTDGSTPLTGVNVIARALDNPLIEATSSISGDRGVAGVYTLNGLQPNTDYVIYTDQILQGGFSTTPLQPLPSVEEFFNGANESNNQDLDDPTEFVALNGAAGDTITADIVFNTNILRPGPFELGDDDNVEIPLPFNFNFCDRKYTSVFVNSNGSLTFGAGDNSFTESAAAHLLGLPRIAGLWDDLSPNQGGQLSFAQNSVSLTVRFDNIPEFLAGNNNTFEIEIRSDGKVNIVHETIEALDGLVGTSCGGDVALGNEASVDFRLTAADDGDNGVKRPRRTRINMNGQVAVYELFDGISSSVDLANYELNFRRVDTRFRDAFEPNNKLNLRRRNGPSVVELPFNTGNQFVSIEAGDIDFYAFTIIGVGPQTLIAEVTQGLTNLDSVLGLFDSTGNLIAVDDDGGNGVLSRIETVVPNGGTFFLAVSSFDDFDFVGNGESQGRYVLDIQSFAGVVTNITLGDDDTVELDLGFSFPFQGSEFTSVFVNSNGNLTFGAGDTDFSESVAELLNGPARIAGVWDDLSPNQGGTIRAVQDASGTSISFIDVPEFLAGNSNNFTFNLSPTGEVTISYGIVDAQDGLAGISGGNGTLDPGATDISAAGALSVDGTTYELFGIDSPFDLGNSDVNFN